MEAYWFLGRSMGIMQQSEESYMKWTGLNHKVELNSPWMSDVFSLSDWRTKQVWLPIKPLGPTYSTLFKELSPGRHNAFTITNRFILNCSTAPLSDQLKVSIYIFQLVCSDLSNIIALDGDGGVSALLGSRDWSEEFSGVALGGAFWSEVKMGAYFCYV